MIITKLDLTDFNKLTYIHLFCQLFHCLLYKNIKIIGPIVYNWIVPCYHLNLNPTQFSSFIKILDLKYKIYLDNQIDIWVETFKDIKFYANELKIMGRNLGYQVDITKLNIKSATPSRKLIFTSLFSSKIIFSIRIHFAYNLNILYDIENLYINCTEESGIKDMGLINESKVFDQLTNPDSFGYTRNLNEYISRLVSSIYNKECILYPLGVYDKSIKIFQIGENILDNGFNILNFPGVLSFKYMSIDKVCAICMEYMTEKHLITKCSHEFHTHCLFQWWKTNPYNYVQCPNCRSSYLLDGLL